MTIDVQMFMTDASNLVKIHVVDCLGKIPYTMGWIAPVNRAHVHTKPEVSGSNLIAQANFVCFFFFSRK